MTYKNLEAWKQSMHLTDTIYDVTASFPGEEKFGLTNQIRRAIVSVPSNLAEGCGRNYKKETIQFCHVSRGSLYEVETQLTIARNRNYLNAVEYDKVCEELNNCLRVLNGFVNYLERSDLK